MEILKKCLVCKEKLSDPIQLPCFHIFCTSCVEKFENGESSSCPQCTHNFSFPDEASQSVFIKNLCSNEIDPQSNVKCSTHPNLFVNFFCATCEITGCPLCSTGVHDGHDLVDLQEMAKVIREELENVNNEVEAVNKKIETNVSKEKEKIINQKRNLNLMCNEIREKGDFLKSIIDQQVDGLLNQIQKVDKRLTRTNEVYKNQARHLSEGSILYFSNFIKLLIKYAPPQDLIDNIRTTKEWSSKVKFMRIEPPKIESYPSFLPSSLHPETLCLIGHIEFNKKPNSQQFQEENTSEATSKEGTTKNLVPEINNHIISDPPQIDPIQLKGCSRKSSFMSEATSGLTVDASHLYVTQERGPVLTIYSIEGTKKGEIEIEGLEAPWDLTSIVGDDVTNLFVVDNLHAKLFHISMNKEGKSNKQHSWSLHFEGSASLSSYHTDLIITTTNNKVSQYTLSSLLSSPEELPQPKHEFSIIPHMTDLLHAGKVDDSRFVVLYHHLYELSGVFLVNPWGHMEKSFGGGRGNNPQCQVDFPCHMAVHAPAHETQPDDQDKDAIQIFVCDNTNDRVSCFDEDLNLLRMVDADIDSPWRLAILPQKRLLFILTLNHTINTYQY